MYLLDGAISAGKPVQTARSINDGTHRTGEEEHRDEFPFLVLRRGIRADDRARR
jgi:hypothetical protein